MRILAKKFKGPKKFTGRRRPGVLRPERRASFWCPSPFAVLPSRDEAPKVLGNARLISHGFGSGQGPTVESDLAQSWGRAGDYEGRGRRLARREVGVTAVYRIPFSTNVERVALAAAYKGVEIDWIDVDPGDRGPVREVSGQELVPVLVDGTEVVFDSPRVLAWLEERYPEPPLWPREPARRAEADVFVEWFNHVWKGPPNELDAELSGRSPDLDRVEALGARMAAWLDVFEALLDGRDYLLGDFGIADVVAFPFLKYGVLGMPEGDDELFHRVLVERLPIGEGHPRLAAWVERVDARPRA